MALERKKIFALLGIALLLIVIIIGTRPMLKGPQDGEDTGVPMQEIPEAEDTESPRNKKDGYRSSARIDDYFDSLEEEMEQKEEQGSERGSRSSRGPQDIQVEDLFADAAGQGQEPSRQPAASASPSRRKAQPGPAERERTDTADSEPASQPPPLEQRPQVKRSGAVSSLDEDVADDLGNGFSTLDGSGEWLSDDRSKPYRCMFTRSEKVRTGQRITLRLLEDLVIGNTHIPKNTHLQGVCSISDRMEISVTSLDLGGRILSLNFQAYDTDGQKGIYCSDLSQVAQEIKGQGISMVSSGLNSRLGRTARDVAAVGASLVRSKSGEATVTIPSGYTFYIIEQTR